MLTRTLVRRLVSEHENVEPKMRSTPVQSLEPKLSAQSDRTFCSTTFNGITFVIRVKSAVAPPRRFHSAKRSVVYKERSDFWKTLRFDRALVGKKVKKKLYRSAGAVQLIVEETRYTKRQNLESQSTKFWQSIKMSGAGLWRDHYFASILRLASGEMTELYTACASWQCIKKGQQNREVRANV